MIDPTTSFRRSLGCCAALAALAAGLSAAPALAQGVPLGGQAQESVPNPQGNGAPTAPETNGEIVVTGSRIVRPDLVASSPVAVINPAAIKANNTVTVEQILTVNPQFVAGSTAASNNPGDGAATVDLRGLGANRTLVLLDGKRMPAYDTTGAVDVNSIPTALLKRVDVLTGGASAVYGSDAIAGVVNFVLDDRFTGLRADASSQVSQQGDGQTRDFSLTGGIKLGDRGNIVASGNYSKRNGVLFGARPHNANAIDSSDLKSSAGSSNANPAIFDLADGSQLQVTPSGALTPNLSLYNFTPVNYAQLPFERYGGTVLGRYQLTDGIEAYARGTYQHVHVVTTLAPTATAGYTFNIDPSNPFLTADERTAFFGPGAQINDGSNVANDPTARAGTSVIGIRRRIVETGGRIEDHTSQFYQGVAGLRGNLGTFNWDVYGQYGEVRKHEILKNDLSYSATAQALDVVAGPGGAPQCFDPSNGCVPLNVFTAGVIPANQLAFVLRNATQDTKTTQIVTGGNISGDLAFLQSPFADHPAAISVGVEYRREKATTTVSDDFASGDLIYYGQGQNIGGKYDTKEAFVEVKAPIVQDKPFIHALDVEGGFRYSDYSTVGSVYTYKGGGDYSPVEGLRFRGIYQRAVRAPNVYELYSPVVGGTGSLNNDPCTGSNVSATIQAICRAQGAPASAFSGTASNIPAPISGQINIFTGGNPNLKAEKTDTFTVGMVVNPTRFRAFTLSIDYYNIRIGNAIDTVPPTITLSQCYFTDQNAASAACSGIKRNPLNGSLSGNLIYGVPSVLGNIAVIKTDGIDVTAGWHGGDMDRFNYAASIAGTFTRNYQRQSDPTADIVQCAGRFGSACNLQPIPKWKHVADVTLGYGKFSLLTRWRFLGAVHEDVGTDILKSRIPAFSYFDQTLSVNVNRQLDFRIGVQNLANKKSPIVGDTVGNDYIAGSTFPGTYDVIGRTFFAGVSMKL